MLNNLMVYNDEFVMLHTEPIVLQNRTELWFFFYLLKTTYFSSFLR